jgi:hypothetical protein
MRRWLVLCVLLFLTADAHATEVSISAQALERTLKTQLFNAPDGRYYLRVVVHIHTRAKLGTGVYGACVGVSLTRDVDVSVLPDAQGETIGFRDARIDHLSNSKELNFLLVPFLSHQLPQQMKVNAADLMRQLLSRSAETTGYAFALTTLKIHSMLIQGSLLVLDVDAGMSVN